MKNCNFQVKNCKLNGKEKRTFFCCSILRMCFITNVLGKHYGQSAVTAVFSLFFLLLLN